MTAFVVDASVAVKWFLPELHHQAARRLLSEGFDLAAPDLIRAEVGNVLWKVHRRGEISAGTATGILRDFGEKFPLGIRSSQPLMETAWEIAKKFDRSFYDGLYVALATRTNRPLATADRKLYNALADTELGSIMLWVEDLEK